MQVGSFVPEQTDSALYAMAGDDCSLHYDLGSLTPKQQGDHYENQVLTCALQIALTGLGKKVDHVALAEAFQEAPWHAHLCHYSQMFQQMGLESVPASHWQYHPLDGFYESVSQTLPAVELLNLYMWSGSNFPLHQDQSALDMSRNVNSKLHFAQHAPVAGLPVPGTQVYAKSAIAAGDADHFFEANAAGLMMKLLGLAGSRNVFKVGSVAQCLERIEEYDDEVLVLLQRVLDTGTWQEMTVDLTITPERVDISNVRQLLFAGGKWVGNYLSPELAIADPHREMLYRVGEYARHHGYVSERGVNCGIDYFIAGDEIMITEINARWTGGLFPAQYLQRLGVDQPAVAFFDMVDCQDREALEAFQSEHLYAQGAADFSYIPMGFTPFEMEIEGSARYFVWQIVVGDFASFVEAKTRSLPEGAFPTADLILKEALK
jgi:hypothetical protein